MKLEMLHYNALGFILILEMKHDLYKPTTAVSGLEAGCLETKMGSREEKSILVLQPSTLRTGIGINNNIYNSWFPSRE